MRHGLSNDELLNQIRRLEKDLSEHENSRIALEKSRRLLDESQRVTKSGGWEYDATAQRLTWTDGVYSLHGVSKDDYDSNDIKQDIGFYEGEDQKTIHDAFRAAKPSPPGCSI